MTQWIKSDTKQIIDTSLGQGISVAGTYYLNRARMDHHRTFAFAAKVAVAGHTATVQVFAEVAGAVTNLGDPLVPTNGSPALHPSEISLTGERGIVVSSLTGVVYPEAVQ